MEQGLNNNDDTVKQEWPFSLHKHSVISTPNNSNDSLGRKKFDVSIATFNILAESYCSPRSHSNLPEEYAQVAFDPIRRRRLIVETLTKLVRQARFDILCLQEVDFTLYEEVIQPHLKSLNFEGVKSDQKGRVDSCAIFWNSRKYVLVAHKIVSFDKLATEKNDEHLPSSQRNSDSAITTNSSTSSDNSYVSDDNSMRYHISKPSSQQFRKGNPPSSLTGLIQSFLRRNTSCLIVLQEKQSSSSSTPLGEQAKNRFAVASAHLYWNPGYEYVKLAQAKYLLTQLNDFANLYNNDTHVEKMPVLVCGDMNSKPGSTVHNFFVHGKVDARRVAPWNAIALTDSSDVDDVEDTNKSKDSTATSSTETIEPASSFPKTNQLSEKSYFNPRHKYLLDFSLNKFTRWLRMLGLDAELETEEEEEERTRATDPRMVIFERCKAERRNLITTSYKLILRKECPPGAFLISPSAQSMETALCDLLLTHGVVLEPTKFLTRCVKCNGGFKEVLDDDEKTRVFESSSKTSTPTSLLDLRVWVCQGCGKGYWWSDRPNSSASRVKNGVTYLFKRALRAGVRCKGSLGMFSFIDVEKERRHHVANGNENEVRNRRHDMEALEWLRSDALTHPFERLRSMYARRNAGDDDEEDVSGELLPFTNVTNDFVGTLDYVFYEESRWSLVDRLRVPTTFKEMNFLDLPKGHLIPSSCWPSDHLAVGGTLRLSRNERAHAHAHAEHDHDHEPDARNKSSATLECCDAPVMVVNAMFNNKIECDRCPAAGGMLSLFQMAELRNQLKEKQKREEEEKQKGCLPILNNNSPTANFFKTI